MHFIPRQMRLIKRVTIPIGPSDQHVLHEIHFPDGPQTVRASGNARFWPIQKRCARRRFDATPSESKCPSSHAIWPSRSGQKGWTARCSKLCLHGNRRGWITRLPSSTKKPFPTRPGACCAAGGAQGKVFWAVRPAWASSLR
jgi:hypothetical protein